MFYVTHIYYCNTEETFVAINMNIKLTFRTFTQK